MKNITQFYFLTLASILFASTNTILAKGISGKYILTGVALTYSGDTLKNQQILMFFGSKTDTIHTDSKGYYSVEIFWAMACPSGATRRQLRRTTQKINPQYIFFTYNSIQIRKKNDWRSFRSGETRNLTSRTKRNDLIF